MRANIRIRIRRGLIRIQIERSCIQVIVIIATEIEYVGRIQIRVIRLV